MSWIKPSQIPHNYWGPAWVTFRWIDIPNHPAQMQTVRQNSYWSESEERWEYMYDKYHRVMIVPQPDHTNAFKETE